jgi:hypothetical protein
VPSATLQIQDLTAVRPPELPPTPAAKAPALYTAPTAPKIAVAATRRPEPAAARSASSRTIFFLLLTGAATFLAGQFLLSYLR